MSKKREKKTTDALDTSLFGELKRIDWCVGKPLAKNFTVVLIGLISVTTLLFALDSGFLYGIRELFKLLK